MTSEQKPVQGIPLQERYEELRRSVLGGWCTGGQSKAMMIFIGEGMEAWMRAWVELRSEQPVRPCPGDPGDARLPDRSNGANSLPACPEQATVNLLVELVLGRLQNSFF